MSNKLSNLKIFTWEDLYAVNFNFKSPFQLELNNTENFIADKILRILPKKRLVALGKFADKDVVAKIFFSKKHAKRDMEKDVNGVKILQENKIPTPGILYEAYTPDKKVYILLFERIIEAQNLEDIWQNKITVPEILPYLQSVIIELATQHVLGVVQKDLHFKNFLLTEKTVFTLDGAQIETFPHLLEKSASIENIALFLAQLGVGHDELQAFLFKYYAKARGWLLKPHDIPQLFLLIKKYNEERWQSFQKKIFRNASEFAMLPPYQGIGMYKRAYIGPEFIQFLRNPELAFQHPSLVMLKNGRSTTVIKVNFDDRELVIKRYNIKNIWHYVRRMFRASRAYMAWRLAHKLNLFGVPTAKPVAFIEQRYFKLRGKSYYVTEYISGQQLDAFFLHANNENIANMINRITNLLKNLAQLEITHGDLKASNILINARQQALLIDLDGAKEHDTLASLRQAWRKEIKRFLQNFDDQRMVREQFENIFQKNGA